MVSFLSFIDLMLKPRLVIQTIFFFFLALFAFLLMSCGEEKIESLSELQLNK